jgi:hypothetical protein
VVVVVPRKYPYHVAVMTQNQTTETQLLALGKMVVVQLARAVLAVDFAASVVRLLIPCVVNLLLLPLRSFGKLIIYTPGSGCCPTSLNLECDSSSGQCIASSGGVGKMVLRPLFPMKA